MAQIFSGAKLEICGSLPTEYSMMKCRLGYTPAFETLWGHMDEKHRKLIRSSEGDSADQDCASWWYIHRNVESCLILTWNFHCRISGWSFQQMIIVEIAKVFLFLRLTIKIMWVSEVTFRVGFWSFKVHITGNYPT